MSFDGPSPIPPALEGSMAEASDFSFPPRPASQNSEFRQFLHASSQRSHTHVSDTSYSANVGYVRFDSPVSPKSGSPGIHMAVTPTAHFQMQVSQVHQPMPDYPYPMWSQETEQNWFLSQAQQTTPVVDQLSLQAQRLSEPRPRLTKEETDILEKVFSQNTKPSTADKRELAQRLRLELARVNNWFQNRRAKEKAIKNSREFEAKQEKERQAAKGDADTPHEPSGRQSSNTDSGLGDDDIDATLEKTDAGEENVKDEGMGSEDDLEGEDRYHPTDDTPVHIKPDPMALTGTTTQGDTTAEPVAHVNDFQLDSPYSFNLHGTDLQHGLCLPATSLPESLTYASFTLGTYAASAPTSYSPCFGYLDRPVSSMETTQSRGSPAESTNLEQPTPASLSSPSISSCPSPSADLALRCPPPADIPTRRNIRRPQPLGVGALRSPPQSQPLNASGVLPRHGSSGKMTRCISSPTGAHRVQKAAPAQRSGLNCRTELLHNLHGRQIAGLESISTSLYTQPRGQVDYSCLADNAGRSLSPEEAQHLGLVAFMDGLPILKGAQVMSSPTPPETPGMSVGFQENWFTSQGLEAPVGYGSVVEQPLLTPSTCSHYGSELEYPTAAQRTLASTNCGPVYDGFGGGPSSTEYSFPNSNSELPTLALPVTSRSRQIQFAQNVTPQDFDSVNAAR
ncbi:hypothetical protein VTK73DRAFT_7949 [Phialemonium thermophilum]|uniref:Homeobox domain-containing protein n=1 Tax=Phialemonium thermophilum TaxID=223376 RepID=A0ABR3XR92_9PEZI